MTTRPLRPSPVASEDSIFPSSLAAPVESQRFLSTLLGNLPGLAYCSINQPDWPITYISQGCEELTGWSPEDFVERRIDFGRLIIDEDRERVWSEVQAALAEQRAFVIRYRLRAKDGREHWIWEKGCGVFDEAGELLRLEGFLFDCTEEKRLEEQLLHAQKMEAVGRLAGGVAHDFNNLLTAILGYGDMLVRSLGEASEHGRHAQQVVHAAQRASDLTRRLLSFARKHEAVPCVFDINEQLLALDPLLRRLVGEDLEFVVLPGENAGTVEADPGQIEQVLVNLVVNARQAMPEGGKLTISTEDVELARAPGAGDSQRKPGRWVLVTVSDSGVGMDPAELEHVFEPFYTTKPDGTGLGLSTCLGIVEQAGGHVEVDSQAGEGSRFRIYLPHTAALLAPRRVSGKEVQRPGNGRLLLVEDEPSVRLVAETILCDLGYTVHSANSGVEALEHFATLTDGVDLLVTDMVMPQMSGRELAKRLRERQPGLPVVFMSGYLGESLSEVEDDPAPTRFLAKPFSRAELSSRVREALATVSPG